MSAENRKETQATNIKADWKKFFNYRSIVSNIPFFLFLSALAVLYIYNGHHADKLVRKIADSERNIPRLLEYAKKLRVMQKVQTIIGVWI